MKNQIIKSISVDKQTNEYVNDIKKYYEEQYFATCNFSHLFRMFIKKMHDDLKLKNKQ